MFALMSAWTSCLKNSQVTVYLGDSNEHMTSLLCVRNFASSSRIHIKHRVSYKTPEINSLYQYSGQKSVSKKAMSIDSFAETQNSASAAIETEMQS